MTILVPCFLLAMATFQSQLPPPVVNPAYLAATADRLRATWPNNETFNIVIHGHSVPAGYFKTPEVCTFHAYPHLLHVGLKERFPNAVINVIVTAKGGEHSEDGEERFGQVLAHQPDVVVIDYALNDRRIGLERSCTAWESMISQSKQAGALVVLMTPTPDINDPHSIKEYAEQIRLLAKEHEVGLCDATRQFEAFTDSGGDLAQVMAMHHHPNAKGHRVVADQLLALFPEK